MNTPAERLRAISYEADGRKLMGYFAAPREAQSPGVLVAHESMGLTGHVKERALELAGMGYAALALDLYGAHDLQMDIARRHSAEIMSTSGLMFSRANAALAVLASQPGVDRERLGAVGFCLGGVAALELGRGNAPIRCAVGFHPGLKRPAGSPDGNIDAKILMMIGDLDPVVSLEDRTVFCQSMTAAQADWQLHIFGGVGHSYTNRDIDAFGLPGFAYDANAARRSWEMMAALLEETLGPRGAN